MVLHADFFHLCNFFKVLFYLSFRETGREGEREGEEHQCVVASHVALTGDLVRNPGMCPDWESNRRPFGSQPMLNPLSHTSQGHLCNFFAQWQSDIVIDSVFLLTFNNKNFTIV